MMVGLLVLLMMAVAGCDDSEPEATGNTVHSGPSTSGVETQLRPTPTPSIGDGDLACELFFRSLVNSSTTNTSSNGRQTARISSSIKARPFR